MSDSGHFKKTLSLVDLTMIGMGTVFGSGWLFAASHVASLAGPAGIFSWVIAAIAVLTLGVVYCELGAALPRTGGAISYLHISHGPLMSYLIGMITVIYLSSMVAIEVVAARQYAAAWMSALSVPGTGNATALGWLVQFAFVSLFFWLNFSSVKRFAKANNIISVFKSEVIDVLLQVAFLGAIPTNLLGNGWAALGKTFTLPFHDIALQLGLTSLSFVVVFDAIISPAGCGSIFFNAKPRAIYAWAKSGTFFRLFTRVDAESGIPRPAMWLAFALSIFWTLSFPSWEAMILVVSAALVVSYVVAPVCVAALRKSCPELNRPLKVKGLAVFGPLSFVVATLIVYWSGWSNLYWLLGVQIVLYVGYLFVMRRMPVGNLSMLQQIRCSLRLVGYYALTLLASYLGPFGGIGVVPHPYDFLMVCAVALTAYYWGANTGVPRELVRLEETPDEQEIGKRVSRGFAHNWSS